MSVSVFLQNNRLIYYHISLKLIKIVDIPLQTYLSVLRLAESYEELYCFSYKPNVDEEERLQEWEFLDLKADYSRMGLPNSLWKLSPVNHHYKVSEPACKTSRMILS